MNDDYNPSGAASPNVLRLDGPSTTIAGTCPDLIVVPEDTPPQDVITLYGIISWAKGRKLPAAFVMRLPELATRDPLTVREICDDLAELGYPSTANDLRAYWRA